MGEALATIQFNLCNSLNKKIPCPLVKCFWINTTDQLMKQRVFHPVYSFKNSRPPKRCSDLPSLGKRSIVTNIDHSVRKILTLQPKILCSSRYFFVKMAIQYLSCSPQNIIFSWFCTSSCLLLVLCVLSAWMMSSSSAIMIMLLCVSVNKRTICRAQWEPPKLCFPIVVTMLNCWITPVNPIVEAETTT